MSSLFWPAPAPAIPRASCRRALALLAVAGSLAAGERCFAQLGKASQILTNRGLQVQGMVTKDDIFHLNTYSNCNYTAIHWLWDSNPSLMGTAPGFAWARWASDETLIPPQGGEGPYMSQLVALQLGDEWNLADDATRTRLVNWFNSIRSSFPNTILFHNNYGGQVPDTPLGDFISRAQPDMISFDSYPWHADFDTGVPIDAQPTSWYGDLRRYRQWAMNIGIPFAAYMQTFHAKDSVNYRDPSPSELRLNNSAALAFNAKVLIDFTYNTGASSLFVSGLGGDNVPTALYAERADAALRARNLGKALVRLKPVYDLHNPNNPSPPPGPASDDPSFPEGNTTGIVFLHGKSISGGVTNFSPVPNSFVNDPASSANPGNPGSTAYTWWEFGKNDPYLTGWVVTNKAAVKNSGLPGDVLLAWFRVLDESLDGPNHTNEVYMMVVNALTATNGTAADCLQRITLNFFDSFTAIEALNPLTGAVQAQSLPVVNSRRQLVLELIGGDAVLFKFSDGAPFVGAAVTGPPAIAVQPSSLTVTGGMNATFSVTATGGSPLSYRWSFNGTNIGGATSTAYTRANAQANHAGSYTVLVTNSSGSVTSDVAILTVNVPPQITTQPEGRTVLAGSNVLFTVLATGSPSPSYQWRFNTIPIAGATTSAYTRTNAQSPDAGSYSVSVSNLVDAILSSDAVLIVNGAPAIASQPQDQAVPAGSNATFTVSAVGTPAPTYQWWKAGSMLTNGGAISGATSPSLTLSNVQSADTGCYIVVAANVYGSVTSAPALLSLATAPTIQVQPQNRSNAAGTPATFNVIASGNGLTYRWRRSGTNLLDGGNIAGSTKDTLLLSSVTRQDAAIYSVLITNRAGSITSAPASLTVVYSLPVQEPFNYPAGSTLGGQVCPDFLVWADVGTGTAGPYITNRSGNLDVNGLAPPVGNNIFFGGLGKSARLSFSVPWKTGTLYYSFAFKVLDLTGAGSGGGFVAGFNNSTGTQAPQPSVVGTRLYLRTSGDGFNLGVAKNSSVPADWVWDNTTFNTNETIFVVGSYTFTTVAATNDDISKLWINPDPAAFGAPNPPPPTLTATNGSDMAADQIASFVFFQRSASVEPAIMAADELRMDTNWAGVTPPVAPAITAQPAGRTNNPGTTATFSVGATGNYVACQWLRNGVALANSGNISGATSATLTLTAVSQSDAATYSVIVTTGGGSLLSAPAALTVNAPPQITDQPHNQSVPFGSPATFNVTAAGTGPLAYQWRFNGTNLPNATTSAYALGSVQRTDAGAYSVLVTNIVDSLLSSNSLLTVTPVAVFLLNSAALLPDGRFQLQGSGDPGYFEISASSNLTAWDVLTNLWSASGAFEFTDPVTNFPRRFYRARLAP